MCVPAPAIVAGVGAAIQIGTSVFGGISEQDAIRSQTQAQISQYQDEIVAADRNAQLARWNRSDVLQRGALAAGEALAAGRRETSAAVTAAGASGAAMTGTNAGVVAQSGIASEIDADRIRSNAARQAWGYEIEEEEQLRTKRQLRRAISYAREGGHLSSVASGLRTTTNVVGGVTNAVGSIYGGG